MEKQFPTIKQDIPLAVWYNDKISMNDARCFLGAVLLGRAKGMAESKSATKKVSVSEELFMWKCPICGREFKNTEQSHYCSVKPKTIDEYISFQDEEKKADLYLVRNALKEALPEAEERISWSMPTYWKGHNIVHFAASKKHIGLYPGPAAVEEFAGELTNYKTDKGTIRIPYGKVDTELIKRIAAWCYETGNHA